MLLKLIYYLQPRMQGDCLLVSCLINFLSSCPDFCFFYLFPLFLMCLSFAYSLLSLCLLLLLMCLPLLHILSIRFQLAFIDFIILLYAHADLSLYLPLTYSLSVALSSLLYSTLLSFSFSSPSASPSPFHSLCFTLPCCRSFHSISFRFISFITMHFYCCLFPYSPLPFSLSPLSSLYTSLSCLSSLSFCSALPAAASCLATSC